MGVISRRRKREEVTGMKRGRGLIYTRGVNRELKDVVVEEKEGSADVIVWKGCRENEVIQTRNDAQYKERVGKEGEGDIS